MASAVLLRVSEVSHQSSFIARWLIIKEDFVHARLALQDLRDDEDIGSEFEAIMNSICPHSEREEVLEEPTTSTETVEEIISEPNAWTNKPFLSLHEILEVPIILQGLLLSILIHATQQLSGIGAVLYFSTTIIATIMDHDTSIKITLLLGGVLVFTTTLSLFLINPYGARALLLVSQGGMSIISVVISIGYAYSLDSTVQICLMVLFTGFYSIGLGSITWLIVPELVPMNAVSVVSSLCTLVNYLLGTVIGIVLPLAITWGTYLDFC
jgi:hypothetical protein